VSQAESVDAVGWWGQDSTVEAKRMPSGSSENSLARPIARVRPKTERAADGIFDSHSSVETPVGSLPVQQSHGEVARGLGRVMAEYLWQTLLREAGSLCNCSVSG